MDTKENGKSQDEFELSKRRGSLPIMREDGKLNAKNFGKSLRWEV